MANKVKVPDYRLKGQSPADVRKLWESKEIDDDEAADYLAFEDMRTSGFYGMDSASVRHLTSRGHMTKEQATDYLDNAESPTWFSIADVLKRSVPHGTNEAVRNAWNFFRDMTGADSVVKLAEEGGGTVSPGLKSVLENDMPNIMPEPKTLSGDLASGITEFMIPFIPANKAVRGMGVAEKLAASPKFQSMFGKLPKLGALATEVVTGAIAGAPADLINDPYEGRLADIAKEAGYLPDYLEFMTTNPNNPQGLERFKNVVEGMGVGAVADGILFLAKALKTKIWNKWKGDASLVAEEIRNAHPDVEPRSLDEVTPDDFRGPSQDTGMAMREDFVSTQPAVSEPQSAKQVAGESQKSKEVYQGLVKKEGGEHVSIATFRDEMGLTQEEMEALLEKGGKEGKIVSLAEGDGAVSGDVVNSGAIDSGREGRPNRLFKPTPEFLDDVDAHVAAKDGAQESPQVATSPAKAMPTTLPTGLEKASPRYKSAEVEFTSDIDKAIYIVSGKGQSKSHEAYRKWLRESVGMSDEQIAEYGEKMRTYLKEQPDSDFHTVPEHYTPTVAPKAPVILRKKAKAEVKENAGPALSPEDINKAEPWQLSREQYSQRIDSVKLPRGRDLASNPKLLDIESMPKEEVEALAANFGVNTKQKKHLIASEIKANLVLRGAFEETGTEVFEHMDDGMRREWYKKLVGKELPKGKASTPDRLMKDMVEALDRGIKASEKQLGDSKHASMVKRAAEEGKDIPGYVLEPYKDSDWAKEYAKKRGFDLKPKAEPTPKPNVEPKASPEATAPKPEAPKVEPAETPKADTDTGKLNPDNPAKPASVSRTSQAIKVFKAETDGSIKSIDEHVIDDSNFLQRIEEGSTHGTVALVNNIYRESADLIEAARKRGSGAFSTIQGKSDAIWKRLSDLSGQNKDKAIETFMGAARGMYADMQSKAAQAHFINEFFTTYAKQVDDLIESFMRTEDRVVGLQAITHVKQLQELQAIVFGIRAEGSRMLNINKMTNMAHKFDFGKLPTEALDEISAAKSKEIKEALASFKNAKDAKTKMRVARSIGKNKFLRGVLEYVQANLLWNPATHKLNFIANTGNLAFKGSVRALAVGAQGLAKGDVRYLRQMGAILSGTFEGLVAGVVSEDIVRGVWKGESWSQAARNMKGPGNAWKALWKGESIIDTVVRDGIDTSDSVLREAFGGTMWTKPLAVAMTSPFNALAAGDEFFKNLAYFSRVKDLCTQAAIEANVPWGEMHDYVRKMQANLPVDIHYKAVDYMRDATFQGKLGSFGQKVEGMLGTEIGTIGRIGFAPFFKTPANIISQAFGMTPLGVLQKSFQRDIMKAGTVEQKEAILKILGGSAMMFAAYQMFEAGLITGRRPKEVGPSWDNAGIQEYSAIKDGKAIGYDRTDPFGMVIGMAADTALLLKYMDAYHQDQVDEAQVWSAFMLTLSESTLNKTWMTSMRDLMQFIGGDSRMNVGKMMARQTEKFLPAVSAVKYVKDQMDPYVRQYNELLDGWHNYFDRNSLPTKRHNLYGTPVERNEKEYGAFRTSKISDDPVVLEMLDINATVKPMSNRIVKGKIETKLTPQEMQRVNDILAEKLPVQETLQRVIDDPRYQSIGDADTRAEILTGIVGGFRSAAKNMFLGESPETIATIKQKALDKADAILGYKTAPDPVARMFNWNRIGEANLQSQPE